MKKCIKCGYSNSDNFRFCKKCGASLNAAGEQQKNVAGKQKQSAVRQQQQNVAGKQQQSVVRQQQRNVAGKQQQNVVSGQQQKMSEKKNSKTGIKIAVIAAAAVLVVILAIIVVSILNGGSIGKQNNDINIVSIRETRPSDKESKNIESESKETKDTERESAETNDIESDSEENTDTEILEANDDKNVEVDLRHDNVSVEDEVLVIREKYNSIVSNISSGKYNEVKLENNITTYYDSGELKAVIVPINANGMAYRQFYYYDQGQLIFAYLENTDSHRFYFYENALMRWRYCSDAIKSSEAVNYDWETFDAYKNWEEIVLEEAYKY